MNIYRQRFALRCPENGLSIAYRLKIIAGWPILIEDIQAAIEEAKALPKPYHENVADFLFGRFGGRQIIKAHHHGCWIETRRGE